MKSALYLIIILFGLKISAYGQDSICHFETKFKEAIKFHPKILEQIEANQAKFQTILSGKNLIAKRNPITIPVVFHIVWKQEDDNISNERILSQVETLNQVFTNSHPDITAIPAEFKSVIGNPNFRFCLAAQDPNGHPTNGILRVQTTIDQIGNSDSLFFTQLGGSSAWDTHKYLNIWVTSYSGFSGFSSFPEDGDSLRGGILLYAQVVGLNDPEKQRGLGRAAVHEIGHYFGLHHIWGDDKVGQDTSCMNDDGFTDTPLQSNPNRRCPDEYRPPPFSCGNFNMYVNFMDYSPDECLSMFTKQQTDYMLMMLETYRHGLLENDGGCVISSKETQSVGFKIYPNPARAQIKILFNQPISQYATLRIYDLRGILVWQITDFLYSELEIIIPEFPQGIYFLKVGSQVQKLSIF